MVVRSRVFHLALVAISFATACGVLQSRDNILRIQLWDAEGLSEEPTITPVSVTATVPKRPKLEVSLELLTRALLGADDDRHRVRHKRRRTARESARPPWRFHDGPAELHVLPYEEDGETPEVDFTTEGISQTAEEAVDEEEEKKNLPVVAKCCASGQNLSASREGRNECASTSLTFQPQFYQFNDTHLWTYDRNLYETIVGNPCLFDRYRLEPKKQPADEFYLLTNGSLVVPYLPVAMLSPQDYCLETFWDEEEAAGTTLPVLCFGAETEPKAAASVTLVLYAVGLLISVPFLLATAAVYLQTRELRDSHGKALAGHCITLATAFCCLAATQLAGRAFAPKLCTVMAYLIQFSFVSCFFWLNVMCFDVYFTARRVMYPKSEGVVRKASSRKASSSFRWYCLYAVGSPLLLLVVTVVMEFSPAVPGSYLKPNFGVKGCWFQTDKAALSYFYAPVSILLLCNLVLFVLTSRAFTMHFASEKDAMPLQTQSSDSDWRRLELAVASEVPRRPRSKGASERAESVRRARSLLRVCCLLSVVMGLSWVLEVVSWFAGSNSSDVVSVWSIFDVVNALQGVLVFAIFVLRQPARSYLKIPTFCQKHRRKAEGTEAIVASDRDSADLGSGRRDFV